MKVILIGNIHPELQALGLKEGSEIEVFKDPESKVGCCHFTIDFFNCIVWPENYKIIEK